MMPDSPWLFPQSDQMLQLLAGHRDSVQSSDFSPRGDCLVSLADPFPTWSQATGEGMDSMPCPYTAATGHWLLGLDCAHLGPACRDPGGLPAGTRGPPGQHQLPLLLCVGPPGEQGCRAARLRTREHTGPEAERSVLQASGSWDKTIHIWKPTTSSLLVQLKGHSTWVRSIAFSPQELWLASAGYSHVVTSQSQH